MMKVLKVLLIDISICDWEFTECQMRLNEILRSIEQRKNEEFETSQPSQAVLEEQRYPVLQGLLGRWSCQSE